MRMRKCKTCGKIFEVPAGKEMYLCPDCAAESKRKSVIRERTCKICGAVFWGIPVLFSARRVARSGRNIRKKYTTADNPQGH